MSFRKIPFSMISFLIKFLAVGIGYSLAIVMIARAGGSTGEIFANEMAWTVLHYWSAGFCFAAALLFEAFEVLVFAFMMRRRASDD